MLLFQKLHMLSYAPYVSASRGVVGSEVMSLGCVG
jgi:hypothetical protein